jgi:hypothetical protein
MFKFENVQISHKKCSKQKIEKRKSGRKPGKPKETEKTKTAHETPPPPVHLTGPGPTKRNSGRARLTDANAR